MHLGHMLIGSRARSTGSNVDSRAVRLLAAFGMVAAVTGVFHYLIRVNATTVALIYFLVVLVCATRWGLMESVAASVAAGLCFDFFFLAPILTFSIADPQNWLAFAAFIVVSLVVSERSARAKLGTEEILAGRHEIERLYVVSCTILGMDSNQGVEKQMAGEIGRIFGFQAIMLLEGDQPALWQADSSDLTRTDELRAATLQGYLLRDQARRIMVAPILAEGRPIGALGISGPLLSEAALNALANLAAICLEKSRAQRAAARAEAARQSQELKSTLLDAIAHEFKTPLTSIKAASTALLSDRPKTPEQRRELLTVVDEEADRLERLVTDAIHIRRIEAGQLHLDREFQAIDDLLSSLLREMKSVTEGKLVKVILPQCMIGATIDAQLFKLALRQVIDNAVKYSPASSPIEISVLVTEHELTIRISDRGPGIPESEQARIFERFYRFGANHHGISGSGMGLAIARQIIEAHRGSIAVENRPEGGAMFSLSVPLNSEEIAE